MEADRASMLGSRSNLAFARDSSWTLYEIEIAAVIWNGRGSSPSRNLKGQNASANKPSSAKDHSPTRCMNRRGILVNEIRTRHATSMAIHRLSRSGYRRMPHAIRATNLRSPGSQGKTRNRAPVIFRRGFHQGVGLQIDPSQRGKQEQHEGDHGAIFSRIEPYRKSKPCGPSERSHQTLGDPTQTDLQSSEVKSLVGGQNDSGHPSLAGNEGQRRQDAKQRDDSDDN